jgi:hypothetical protein
VKKGVKKSLPTGAALPKLRARSPAGRVEEFAKGEWTKHLWRLPAGVPRFSRAHAAAGSKRGGS